MENCIFCKIINKEIPAKIQYEDEEIIAFDDIKPDAPVHILVVPKIHLESTNEITKENTLLVGKMILIAKDLAEKNNIDQSGYRLIFNTGEDAHQIVKHLHLHLLGGKSLSSNV